MTSDTIVAILLAWSVFNLLLCRHLLRKIEAEVFGHQQTQKQLERALRGWRDANKRTAHLLLMWPGDAPALGDMDQFGMTFDSQRHGFTWAPSDDAIARKHLEARAEERRQDSARSSAHKVARTTG